jgi:hypothetical protein
MRIALLGARTLVALTDEGKLNSQEMVPARLAPHLNPAGTELERQVVQIANTRAQQCTFYADGTHVTNWLS